MLRFIVLTIIVLNLHDCESKYIDHSLNNSIVCLIRNQNYKDEYLYTIPVNANQSEFKLYTNKLHAKYMYHGDQVVWILKPVKSFINTYLISSELYKNEYLCTNHTNSDRLKIRRNVYLSKMDRLLNGRCMWQIEKIKQNDYYVWNFYFKEPLYASFLLNSIIQSRRNVYLWRGKPDSKQFIWNFECRHNI
jgi:hypothetical protein